MRGNDKVIAELNKALSAELTAIAQYMVHAEMQSNWGYNALGAFIKKQAIDEMRHAEGLIERILYLDIETCGLAGEPLYPWLSRIAVNDHKQITICPGDRVVISARVMASRWAERMSPSVL